MGRYLKGRVDETLTLSALAAATAAITDFDEVVNERTLVSSLVATWSMDDFTEGADSGPIEVGVAHNDYTGAEIEEFLENTGSWNEGAKVEQEISRRQIRAIGVFESAQQALGTTSLNEGKPLKTKLNWILNQGDTLRLWAYNRGTAAVATTVPNVHASGHANLWPR